MALSAEYPQFPHIDVEDYLTLDNTSTTAKYEYLDGEISMLAGGSPDHSLIATNLTAILKSALRKTPCVVYNSDVRVKLSEARYVHPDATVTCDERDRNNTDSIEYPRIIVEVLSPRTEAIDRGKKLIAYRSYPTLEDYILIDSRCKAVEVFHREGKKWVLSTFGPGDAVEIPSLDLQIPIDEIYEKTRIT
jgi:Uma2 family endonuclease